MNKVLLLTAISLALQAADSSWLSGVAPIITPAERKAYLSLSPDARALFENTFWDTRSIDREEYYRRLEYIDSKFGSSKRGSGANTDPGRVYLSLGAPAKITRIPSSRIFVPLEIWYYDSAPGYLNTELRLIFYRLNSVGLPKLYSPTVDTVRALLLPEASTVHLFGPNDSVTESDIRQNLKTGPAEDEVITAATGVASGSKYSGNQEILGQVTSPELMLTKPRATQVTSRFLAAHSMLDVLKTPSIQGASQIDLRLATDAWREIGIEVRQGFATVYNNRLNLNFTKAEPVEYTHRLDLLPGLYQLIFTVDGRSFTYPLEIPDTPRMGEIVRASAYGNAVGRHAPFEFAGRRMALNPGGPLALVAVPQSGNVTWTVREGWQIVWRSVVYGDGVAVIELPALKPGAYKLEAATASDSRSVDLQVPATATFDANATVVSFNANLSGAQRLAFVGNQWLLHGRLDRARTALSESLAKGETKDAQIAMARLDAISGSLDAARDRVRGVLASHPDDFEALAVFAYIETRFQDYRVAAELYRRALAVQESPALRLALAKLPTP
jgi:GWxTD domain-containing protein